MFRPHRPPTAPDKIYSSSMKRFPLGHGMWYPEPHKSGELRIGDVGFMKEGAFIQLFNLLDASSPEGQRAARWKKPFVVSDPPSPDMFEIDERRRPIARGTYHSHGVQSQRYHASAGLTPVPATSAEILAEYTCKASQGAVLALKSEAHAQTIFENIDLKQYVLRHHGDWCAYVRDVLRWSVKPSAIVMISGWVKTSPDWAVAAFNNISSSASVSFKGGAAGSASVSMGAEHTTSEDGSPMHREGEGYATNEPRPATPPLRDQSIFVKRFKVRRRIVRSIVAGAGYHHLPPRERAIGGDIEAHVERWIDPDEGESEGEIPDLVDVLLDYMFETTAIEMAVASDDDVACIVGEDSVEDFANYLRDRQPPVEIDGSELPVGFFRKESIIQHRQERSAVRRAITRADWIQWPNITMDGASILGDVSVFVGPTAAAAHHVKLKTSTFIDPQHPMKNCRCSVLSPDGKLLAASFRTSSIFLWRLSDGMLVCRLQDDELKEEIACLAFSPDGTEIFAGGGDQMVTAWNIRTGTIRLRFGPHEGKVRSIACSPYEPYIGTAANGNPSLYVWDRSTGQRLATFSAPSKHIFREITFVPPTFDTSNVYTRARDSSFISNIRSRDIIRRIDLAPGRLEPGPGYFSRSVSHRGDRILVKTWKQGLQILDAHSGELQITIPNSENLTYPAGFSADDKEVYATCKDANAAQSFDSRTGDVRYRYELSDNVFAGAYSPDGAYLAFCTINGEVQVHDPISGTFLARAAVNPHRARTDYAIAFTTDGQSLAVHEVHGSLQILNVSDMMRVR